MSNVLRLALVDPNDTTRDSLRKTLLGMDSVWLEAECSRYEFFSDVVTQTHPDIGLVAIDDDPDKALELIASLGESCPDCSVLVVSSSTDGNLILRVMRAGAKEFLTQPLRLEDLASALSRMSDRHFGRGDGKSRGSQLIAVAGAAGGVGTTSIAVNLGCALAQKETNSVTLVDLDLCLGDADVQLDAIPEYTLIDVSQNVTRLDFALLKRSLTKHSSDLYLLPRPVQLEDVPRITSEDIQRVIGLLRASFSHVVLDLSKSYNPIDMIALEMATDILLVIQLDLPCLRNVVRLMASFKEMSDLADKISVVVNRVGLEEGQITLKKAEETIGREIFWQLPNDYRTMIEVCNNGVPLVQQAPKAGITHAMIALANALEGTQKQATSSDDGKSGLGRLLSLWPNK